MASRFELAEHLANLMDIHVHYYNLGESHPNTHGWIKREMSRTALELKAAVEKHERELEYEGDKASERQLQSRTRRPPDGPAKGDGS